jgi:hypothetical protein
VAGAALYVEERYREHYGWRDAESAKLASLHAGYTLERFQAVLGAPTFSRTDRTSKLREDSFRRRDYWVQAVSREDGTVLLYAVTVCDPDFRPQFSMVGYRPGGVVVQLGKSTLASVLPRGLDGSVEVNYSQGVTANTTYMDESYRGNPSNYKTYVWGVNDACPNALEQLYQSTGFPTLPRFPYRSSLARVSQTIKRFRAKAQVNTFAETAPMASLQHVNQAFQTGMDRLLTRTSD